MKHIRNSILILTTLGVLTEACTKDRNVFPSDAYTDGNLIRDEQTAKTVLNGVYYRFAYAGTNSSGVRETQWTAVNEYFPSELAGSLVPIFTTDDSIFNFTFTPSFPLIDTIWDYCYNMINAASGFIKNAAPVNNIPAASKRQMLSEARFLRAFARTELLFYFAQYRDPSSKYGIILRDTFVTVGTLNEPRSSVAEAYASILADLDAAIDGLPVKNTDIYYANAASAKLLKARVLINRGIPGDYSQVISLTSDIISNGPFLLEDSLKDIFLRKGFNSSEVMLGIQPYPGQRYKSTALEWGETPAFTGLLTGDARSRWMYFVNADWLPDAFNEVTKYYAGKDPSNPRPTPLNENCYAFRLTEAYLLKSEAIVLSGGSGTTAKSLLSIVLAHSGAGLQQLAAVDSAATQEALQLEIVKENLRNFLFENGVDWLALRRLPFAAIQRINPNIKDPNRLILPIPAAELNYNPIIQNPGVLTGTARGVTTDGFADKNLDLTFFSAEIYV